MKKKIILVLMAAVLSASLVGCGEDVEAGTTPSGTSQVSSSAGSAASSSESSGLPQGDQSVIDSFGREYFPQISGANYKINLLRGTVGQRVLGCLYSNAKNHNTKVSYGMGQHGTSDKFEVTEVKTLEDILPTYEKKFFKMYTEQEEFTLAVENQKIQEDKTERVKINEYEFCVTRGTYTFDLNASSVQYSGKYPFTCYATFLTNGTPVFWFTTDISEDGSANAEQEELALNMAKTLREFDPEA